MCRKFGAPEESRTPDPRLKRALLYQLSYRRILNCPVCTVSPLILRPLVTPFRHKTRSSYSDFIPPNKIAVHVFIMVERDGNDPSSCGFSDRRSDLLSVLTDLKFHTTLCCTVNPKPIFCYRNLSNNFLFAGLIFCQCFPWHSNSPLVMPVGIEPTTSSLRGW